MNQVTQAVILAAGLGTRLKYLTQHTPKALMDVAGTPAIIRVIRNLVAVGIQDIAIDLHHHASQIRDVLGHGSAFNANLYYSYEATLLDSGGGVRTALDLLPDGEKVIVHNADIMTDIGLRALGKLCPQHGCALALVPNPKHNPQGDFSLEQQHIMHHNIDAAYTFSGVSVWHKQALRTYPTQESFSLVQPIHQQMKTKQCLGVIHRKHWFDIGRPHDLIQANRFYNHEGL